MCFFLSAQCAKCQPKDRRLEKEKGAKRACEDAPAILKTAAETGVKQYFIEDEAPTAAEQIQQSLRYWSRRSGRGRVERHYHSDPIGRGGSGPGPSDGLSPTEFVTRPAISRKSVKERVAGITLIESASAFVGESLKRSGCYPPYSESELDG